MWSILTLVMISQGWGVAVLVGVPYKDAMFKTHPMNFLNERTLKGTFFGNYKPRSDLPAVVEMYMNKVRKLSQNSFLLSSCDLMNSTPQGIRIVEFI